MCDDSGAMNAYVRPVTEGGTIVDLRWFCSEDCWLESLDDDPPSEGYGWGGAAEMPDGQACGTCLAGSEDPGLLEDARLPR
jgi:hypothetical protein